MPYFHMELTQPKYSGIYYKDLIGMTNCIIYCVTMNWPQMIREDYLVNLEPTIDLATKDQRVVFAKCWTDHL